MQETWVQSLSQEDPLKEETATHSSILAWKIPRMEEPGGLQSMESGRVRHNWATENTHTHTHTHTHTNKCAYLRDWLQYERYGWTDLKFGSFIYKLGVLGLKKIHIWALFVASTESEKNIDLDVNFRKICNWMLIQCPAYYSKGSIDGYKYC